MVGSQGPESPFLTRKKVPKMPYFSNNSPETHRSQRKLYTSGILQINRTFWNYLHVKELQW